MRITLLKMKNPRGITTSATMGLEDAPVTYERTPYKRDYDTKEMEFIKVDGTTKVKLELPIYNDQVNMELLPKLIKSFNTKVEAYYLFTYLGEPEVYDKFYQCLGGDAYDTWDAIVENVDETSILQTS